MILKEKLPVSFMFDGSITHLTYLLFYLGGEDYTPPDDSLLQIGSNKLSVQYKINITNDTVTERDEETFTLHLYTKQNRVRVASDSSEAVVNILDDDGWQHM